MKSLLDSFRKRTAYLAGRPFYRKHRPPAGMKLSTIDARGAIDFDLGVFYNRIPKAANSFIVLELFKLKTAEAIADKVAKKRFLKPSELDGPGLERFDRLLKFTFVRNPYSRTLSAFLDKIVRKKEFIPEISKSRVPTFAEFCAYLEEGGLHANVHWAPQAALILLPVAEFDHIGKIENMDVDLPRVIGNIVRRGGGRVGEADEGGEEEGPFRKPNADEKVRSHYDRTTIDIVGRLFADDFRLFNYDKM